MKTIFINKRKLRNNKGYNNLVKEMKSYENPNFIPKDKECWEYRKHKFENASCKQIGNIRLVIQPNETCIPNIKDKKKPNYMVREKDYTINFFYKGAEFGTYSGHSKCLQFDYLLKDSDFIEKYIELIKKEIPFKDYSICYGSYYVDWDNRPFVVANNVSRLA